MRLRSASLLAVLATTAVAAAGCGGSSSSGSRTSAAAATSPAAATSKGAATISTGSTSELGTFLVDAQGRTLYLWKADTGTKSTCSGACAAAWPPVTTTGAPTAHGAAKSSALGTTRRSDGSMQVTYNGHPLYLYAGDAKRGDVTGQGSDSFGAAWYVVSPQGNAIDRS